MTEQKKFDSDIAPRQSHLISRVLAPAMRLWLRSQVERVDELQVQMAGGDRELLTGHIAQITISAKNAVYQGLHLSQICLTGSNIQINLGQVLRGKPLRLLHPIPVQGELLLHQPDLNASLQSPLLTTALTDFLVNLLRSPTHDLLPINGDQPLRLHTPQVGITPGQLTLRVNLMADSGALTAIALRTGLTLFNSHTLALEHPQWLPHLRASRGLPLKDLHNFQVDLGTDVSLQELTLSHEQLVCRGCVTVIPG